MIFKELSHKWAQEKILFVKTSTFSAYSLLLRNKILPYFGDKEMESLKNSDFQEFALSCLNGGLSKKTVIDIMVVLKMVIRYGVENELAPNLSVNIRYPTSSGNSNKKIEVYTQLEQKAIASYVLENPSARNLGVLLTMCTGMRIGEICGLKWSCVDLDNKVINVRQTLQRVYYEKTPNVWATKIIEDDPKTQGSNRDIPIPTGLMQILKNYKKTVKDNYYVTTGDKIPIEPRTYRNYYVNLIKYEVKLDKCFKFHSLRHTFATKMIESGIDIKTVSSILGHSKVTLTMDLYVHPSETSKALSINKAMKHLF